MRLCTGYFQRNRSRDDHCWWKGYIRYPHIFENRYFLLRFKKKKKASTRSVFESFSPVHTNTLKRSKPFTPLPHVTYPFLFENGDFSAPVWPTVHTHSVKTVTENASFQKRSIERRFLKTLPTCLRADGRKRRFSNTMMS